MPWSAVTRSAASSGSPSTQLLDDAVDERELGPPAGRVDAADVTGEVELGEVAVDEGSRGGGQGAQDLAHEVAVARPRRGSSAPR